MPLRFQPPQARTWRRTLVAQCKRHIIGAAAIRRMRPSRSNMQLLANRRNPIVHYSLAVTTQRGHGHTG